MNTATPSKPPRAPGYWYALSGFLLGSVESVAFNILAAFITPTGYAFEAWLSLVPALLGAAVWPVALLVSVEVLARVEWSRHWGWWVLRVSGILAVALGSAVISYGHIHAVLEFWGYGWKEAAVGPLVIDGLMLISGFALYTIGRASRAALDTASHAPVVPHRPDPPVGEEHAVSVTSPIPDNVTETAPQEASRSKDGPSAPARPSRSEQEPPVSPGRGRLPQATERQEVDRDAGGGESQPPARPERPASQQPHPEVGETAPSRETQDAPAGREAEHQHAITIPAQEFQDPQIAEAIARIQEYQAKNEGKLPTPNWVKNKCGMGHARASRLLNNINDPELGRVELHAVHSAAV